jgi:hypothetical protein
MHAWLRTAALVPCLPCHGRCLTRKVCPSWKASSPEAAEMCLARGDAFLGIKAERIADLPPQGSTSMSSVSSCSASESQVQPSPHMPA